MVNWRNNIERRRRDNGGTKTGNPALHHRISCHFPLFFNNSTCFHSRTLWLSTTHDKGRLDKVTIYDENYLYRVPDLQDGHIFLVNFYYILFNNSLL